MRANVRARYNNGCWPFFIFAQKDGLTKKAHCAYVIRTFSVMIMHDKAQFRTCK